LADYGVMTLDPDQEGVAVPTRNVNLTDELDRFVLEEVESGRYEDASEVVRGTPDTGTRGATV
jgi:hypothetical protein